MYTPALITNRHEHSEMAVVVMAVALGQWYGDTKVIPRLGSLSCDYSPSAEGLWMGVIDVRPAG